MDRPDGKGLEREPLEPPECLVELERHLNGPATHGCKNTHRLALQAPQHEPEDLGRACIDPLHVVEGDKKRPGLSMRAHDREEREPEQAHLRRRPVRLPHQQRGLKRPPLNRRQLRQRLLHHRREQIADGCEREMGLGMGRARRQDAEAALACEPITLLPDRGLADSRVALKQQCLSASGNSPQKPIKGQQFLAPADQLDCHRSCSAGQSRPTPLLVHPHSGRRSFRPQEKPARCPLPPRARAHGGK
jgi:hypothetical protein